VPPASQTSTLAFSAWVEDDYDNDSVDDGEGEWSDEEDDEGDGELPELGLGANGQTGVWDSGVVLQLPGRS
jgi:hypothetical protein